MEQAWKSGMFEKELDKGTNDFNSSISFDAKLYVDDIMGSIAHARMLGETGIITNVEAAKIMVTLERILTDLDTGKLKFDPNAEDIHMFVEKELTKRLKGIGEKLHTARSRNDQVALDLKLYVRRKTLEISQSLHGLIEVIAEVAEQNIDTIMPGYTHLQRAQPITFAQHLLAYAFMFMRDDGRLNDNYKRMNLSPLGSGAIAGTSLPIDRQMTASTLDFDGPMQNSLDGISDRDYVLDLAYATSVIMMHLSRLSEEVILWCSSEFSFLKLDDAYSTGSSAMPQKKNPDIAELCRGKTGRVYGNLMALLTVMKGIPLAYNKDMQEDKEAIFDSIETVLSCLKIFTPMLKTAKANKQNMRKACDGGFLNATEVAEYLVKKGLPFRTAYGITGDVVKFCIDSNCTLETVSLEDLKKFSPLFDESVFAAVDIENAVANRNSEGGPAKESVLCQLDEVKKFLGKK